MTWNDQRRDDQLMLNWLAFRIFRSLSNGDSDQVPVLDPHPASKAWAYHRCVIPGQLRDRIGHFLEPAIVRVTAVIHRITANENNFRGVLARGRELVVP